MMSDPVRACLIIIGNEILSGRTHDKNLPYLAEELNTLGVRLVETRVIPDIEDTIIETLNECRAKFDYVFTTGGIGPTHDDITSECVAKAFGVAIELNADAHDLLKSHYDNPADLNEARLRMARIPVGAELIQNPISKAPGFRMENVYVMAGVPMIMQAMFQGIKHQLIGGKPMVSRSVGGYIPEGTIAKVLAEIQGDFPATDIGSYPFLREGKLGTTLVVRGEKPDDVNQAAERIRLAIIEGGKDVIEDTGTV
ncbi:competence/damage-inducible protein A [Thalassospira tepidiphila]|jgi:molybdenum cofactor synthesis domain-containing protein|uniref:competence/damage-inducible protein A n=1 Tax=Thalassospira tepidiphila TaxID=393657 RepID=UPI001BCAEC34|nr:molybdopterin-binding protein [Thalassospira tepidiphila]MBS8273222.1 competence/damage-inducible protein A [Thalassospira tepidiphila]